MNIGQLKHRIEFQRLESTYDKEGFPIEEYVTFQKEMCIRDRNLLVQLTIE